MAMIDETNISTMEKDFIVYKGEVVEDFNGFILRFIEKGIEPLDFKEDIRNNAKLPLYLNLDALVNIYKNYSI